LKNIIGLRKRGLQRHILCTIIVHIRAQKEVHRSTEGELYKW